MIMLSFFYTALVIVRSIVREKELRLKVKRKRNQFFVVIPYLICAMCFLQEDSG